MGRAHSNAWFDVGHFYKLPFKPVMKAACDIDHGAATGFADRLGWQSFETSWEELVRRRDIDIIDICTPNRLHMPIAIAAARSGKHLICEKPLAMNADEARQMIDEGVLGTIHHFQAVYYQDWLVDPEFPWVWRHDAEVAGSGAHGDMNAHTVDLARFLVGEIVSVVGDNHIFIKQRKQQGGKGTGTVTADDATCFLARFENGALGNFTATRFATGKKNVLRLEIFGSKGSITFNLERLNELEYFSRKDPGRQQGYRTIMVTEGTHPYLDKWWPPGHIIGWEHTFIHEIGDFLMAIAEDRSIAPDFFDGWRCQQVLDAVGLSAREKRWIAIPSPITDQPLTPNANEMSILIPNFYYHANH